MAVSFDSVRHDLLLGKVARRVRDAEVLHLLKLVLTASGKRGVPQGGVISPLLANVFLTEVDAMLERAKEVTQHAGFAYLEYARYADDLVILVQGNRRQEWLLRAVDRRLREELAKLDLDLTRLSQVVPAPVAVVDHGYNHPEGGAIWGRGPVGHVG